MHSERIERYLKEKNMNREKFAKLCRVHKYSVSNWLNKKTSIRPRTCAQIERFTEGEIKYEELTNIPRKTKWMSVAQKKMILHAIK